MSAAASAETKTRKKKKLKFIKPLIIIAVLAVIGFFAVRYFQNRPASAAKTADTTYRTAAVERRDITSTITGSAALEAADSYSVTTILEKSILTANFEEGDEVKKGDVLYTIDSSDAETSVEQAQISLEKARRDYQTNLKNQSDLSAKAPAAGRVFSIDVDVGDKVNAGQTLATIRNSDVMELVVPFLADETASFAPGQTAEVVLDGTFETLNGTIKEISGNDIVLTGNMVVRNVTILVQNPGALSTAMSANARIGGVEGAASGALNYESDKALTASVTGEVAAILAAEGSWVGKDQAVIQLSSTSVTQSVGNASDSVRNAEISLENQRRKLEDYTITSPIDGTIIDKNYNAGETTEANKVLCTIYDLKYLTMTLSVDELDISNISAGQKVQITADAVEGKTYEGVVTKVSVAGSSSNGVTTYPVTIQIDETDGLLPGMNVDATIVLDSVSDVLTIPAAALQRGNTVLVTAGSPSAANASQPAAPDGAEPAEQPEGAPAEAAGSSEYVPVSVTVGISDGDNIEIQSGLQEGDTVAYIPTGSGVSFFDMMGGMPGGMPGGGMPGGGMPGGGMPGGGPR